MHALKRLRLKRGLTQEELADILHVNRTTVTLWENGTNKPRANMLVKLSKVLALHQNVWGTNSSHPL